MAINRLIKTCIAAWLLFSGSQAYATSVLYGVNVNNELVTIDVASGSMTTISALSYSENISIFDIAFDPVTGALLAKDGLNGLVSINTTTGEGTIISPNPDNFGAGLAVDSNGDIYSHSSLGLTKYNPEADWFEEIVDTPLSSGVKMTADTNTQTFYAFSGPRVWSIDEQGDVHEVGHRGISPSPRSIAFDSQNNLLYGLGYDILFTIDTYTGDTTIVTNLELSQSTPPIRAIAFAPSVVPIPAAVWLFGSALAGLGWLGRKQTA